jgi:hypothetical protein
LYCCRHGGLMKPLLTVVVRSEGHAMGTKSANRVLWPLLVSASAAAHPLDARLATMVCGRAVVATVARRQAGRGLTSPAPGTLPGASYLSRSRQAITSMAGARSGREKPAVKRVFIVGGAFEVFSLRAGSPAPGVVHRCRRPTIVPTDAAQ